jgi:hypothetical protein
MLAAFTETMVFLTAFLTIAPLIGVSDSWLASQQRESIASLGSSGFSKPSLRIQGV